MRRLKAFPALARISNLPTILSNCLAGSALAGVSSFDFRVVVLMALMSCFYTAGMILNDVCDYPWDAIHKPNRPLVRGDARRDEALFLSISLMTVGLILAAAISAGTFFAGLVLCALIVLYDCWHKNNPVSPLLMGLCRAMVYVICVVAFSDIATAWARIGPAGLLCAYVAGLTALAKMARHNKNMEGAIGHLIVGISIVDAVVIALFNFQILFVILSLLAGVLTFVLQKYIKGT